MPVAFSDITTLLTRCEDIETHDPPFLPKDKVARLQETIESWFRSHRRRINELDVEGATSLLSSLLPERRTDRVYGIQALSLCRILGRGLSLSAARLKDLHAYKDAGRGDLAQCFERVLNAGGPPAMPAVSLQEVDEMLRLIAGQCRFSDPQCKLPPGSSEMRDNAISNIFKRVSPQEGKWLVRLVLKDFLPVQVNEMVVLKSFHFLLPDLLRFQNKFEAAVCLLKTELREYHEKPDPRSERLLRQGAAALLCPAVGIKIGRPDFHKARSIDHCMKMLGGKAWVLERKYDGEYCEVHVDLRKSSQPSECIQIFSKSGKDSTADRQGILQTLVNCLKLGRPDCKIRRQAIIIGELVVYTDDEQCIAPFHKIRRHVTRSGVILGADEDSLPAAHEHLAIVFFDLLLLDDEIVMRKPVEERRVWLREVYRKIPGRAIGAEWKIVDFSSTPCAKKRLVDQFAASIARRCEGLVLKPCKLPYFPLGRQHNDGVQGYIKLKKDYIYDMGDEADFAVIGASYNAQQAAKSGMRNIRWTNFHLGCIINASDVQRFDARPVFKVVGTIQQEACISKPILSDINKLGALMAQTYEATKGPPRFDLDRKENVKMDVTFDDPFVFEVLGSGFEKPSNCDFYMLRHARVKKLHRDRTWKDCVSFQQLQEQASAARAAPADSESQETRRWLAKLGKGHKRKIERERTPVSRSTRTSLMVCRGMHASTETSEVMSSAISPCLQRVARLSMLNGSTLVNVTSPSRKREHRVEDTKEPPAKKLRTFRDNENPASLEHVPVTSRFTTTQPLQEITNQAAQPSVLESRHSRSKGAFPSSSATAISRRPQPSRPRTSAPKHYPVPTPSPRSTDCAHSRCLFANTVLLLTPCISRTPYITEDLLGPHEALVVTDLQHWDRASFTHPPLTSTVPESQSHLGRRKIVLVETRRPHAVHNIVRRIAELGGGRLRERVEVYDWRVLEECAVHDCGAEALKRWFLGATLFDEAQERCLFVSTRTPLEGW